MSDEPLDRLEVTEYIRVNEARIRRASLEAAPTAGRDTVRPGGRKLSELQFDLCRGNQVVGVEILDAGKRASLGDLTQIDFKVA